MARESVIYEDGAVFPYLGREYVLKLRQYPSYKRPGILPEENCLLVLTAMTDADTLKKALKSWYVQQAKQIIPKRVAYYAEQMGEAYGDIRIKDVKSRWGSCSSKRNLNFNWRLVLAPMEMLDYVVVHELCHLKEMNHSPAFWRLVEAVLPDYKKRRAWLKECRLIEKF